MLTSEGSYADICGRFQWNLPARFNIGVAVCDRWAKGENRPALIYEDEEGVVCSFILRQDEGAHQPSRKRLFCAPVGRGDQNWHPVAATSRNGTLSHCYLQAWRYCPATLYAVWSGSALAPA